MQQSGPAHIDATQDSEESTAAGIYGLIVSAAVMAAAHAPTATATVIAVLTTLSIYWVAERYARIVAERIHAGHRPGWHSVRRQLTSGWEMITTSLLPLAVLVVMRLAGAELRRAVVSALVCSTLLLCAAGWRIGHHGRLSRLERLASGAVAGVFGLGLILLKSWLH